MVDSSTIEIRGDASPLEGALNSAVSLFTGFGTKVMGLASMILPALSFGDAISNIIAGMSDFAATEKGVAQLNTQLKATEGIAGFTSDQLEEMNEVMQGMSKHGDDAIRSAQSALLKFQNVRGDVFNDALKGALDLSAATGTDLSSAAERLGKALNDPLKGIKALRSEGVAFSADQKKVLEQMIATGDVVGVQKIMLEALAGTFGGSAAAEAQTFSGQMEKLGEIVGDMWKAMGGLLVPVLQKFIPIAQNAGKVVTWLTEFAVDLFLSIAEYAEKGIDVAIQWLLQLLDHGVVTFTFLETLVTHWSEFSTGTIQNLQAAYATFFAIVIEGAVSWSQAVIDAFTQVLNIGVSVFEHLGRLGQWFYDTNVEFWSKIAQALKDSLLNMYQNFESFMGAVKKLVEGEGFDWRWKGLEQSAKATFKALPQFIHTEIGSVLNVGEATGLNDMAQTFRENAAGLKDAASKNLGKFGEGFDESLEKNRKLVADFIGTGLDAIGGPKEGPKGKESESPFVLPTEPKEDKEEGGKAGEFEDLLSLNKRIAAGAAKTPEQRELEQGNDIARQQLEAIKGLRQDTQDNTEQLANLELKAPNQGGTFVA